MGTGGDGAALAAADTVTIGVLALQGAFREHIHAFLKLSVPPRTVEVRGQRRRAA